MSLLVSVVEATIQTFHFSSGSWAVSIALLPMQIFNFRQQRILAKIQPDVDFLSQHHKDEPVVLFKKYLSSSIERVLRRGGT